MSNYKAIDDIIEEKKDKGISFEDFPYGAELIEFLDCTQRDYEIICIEPFVSGDYLDYFIDVLIDNVIYVISFHVVDVDGEAVLILTADYCYNAERRIIHIYNGDTRLLMVYN